MVDNMFSHSLALFYDRTAPVRRLPNIHFKASHHVIKLWSIRLRLYVRSDKGSTSASNRKGHEPLKKVAQQKPASQSRRQRAVRRISAMRKVPWWPVTCSAHLKICTHAPGELQHGQHEISKSQHAWSRSSGTIGTIATITRSKSGVAGSLK